MEFDCFKSEISREPAKVSRFVDLLERRLGHGAKIAGILEIGSFAKGEAVPSSDSDLRIYVESPEVYFWQLGGSRQHVKTMSDKEKVLDEFTQTNQKLPRLDIDWDEFNEPAVRDLSNALGLNLEFGLVDVRFANFQLGRLKDLPAEEYALLFQSNVIHDPTGRLRSWRQELSGRRFAPLCAMYQTRYLDDLPFEVYTHVDPGCFDKGKLEKSGQIIWVKWALRAVRDAVASKCYLHDGKFVYTKNDVLSFYRKRLPRHYGFVRQLYEWKTDIAIREKMVKDFIADPGPFFERFKELMRRLKEVVADVNKLDFE